MKVYDFIIELKRPSYRSINWVSQLLYLISLVVFFMILVQKEATRPYVLYIAIIGIIASWIYCIITEKKDHQPYYIYGLLFAAAGWNFIPNGGGWITLFYLVAALIEKQVKFPQEIAFGKDEIVFNTFPKKIFSWEELNNVIIKDGIITVDFKTNKLIQKEIQSGSSKQDELDFNEFCQNRLKTATAL